MELNVLNSDEQAVLALRNLYRQYGYLPYKMSRFEEYDLYVRNKDFLLSDEVITFSDRNGRLLALKPDVTLSIIKNAPDRPGVIQKVYYHENVYRMDGATRTFKEIMQAGLECVGDLGAYEIAEVVLLAAKSLQQIGHSFVLDLSHMGLIASILDSSGLSADGKQETLTYLRQKNAHELLDLCNRENVKPEQQVKLSALVSGGIAEIKAALTQQAEWDAFRELESICRILDQEGFGDSVRVDFSVGNDMKYYSGVVFKGYLEGIPASVLSGGQYDKLLVKMGRGSRAIGFAVYADLLRRRDVLGQQYDVDTVLLHDGTTDPAELLAAAKEAGKEGSVLVCTTLPEERRWRRMIRFEKGEATTL